MKILVVGLGSMGRRRLRNLTLIGGHELGGFELLDDRRKEVGAEFDIPMFASFDEALEWEPEALVISTPPDHHNEYAIAALERGLHFFTEASVVPDGMDKVLAAAEGKTTVAAPSCTMRFHPAVQKIRERLATGTLGKPLAVTHHVGQYLPDWHPWEDYRKFYVSKRETGAAREIVPFELNWLSYLFGRVISAACIADKLSDLEADIDDIYSSVLQFDSRVHATLVVEVISRPAIRRARIICESGTLEWDWNDKVVREYSAETGKWVEFPDPPPVQGPGGEWVAENMYIEEMRGYLRAIADGQQAWPYSIEEDHRNLELLRLLEESSARRSEIPA